MIHVNVVGDPDRSPISKVVPVYSMRLNLLPRRRPVPMKVSGRILGIPVRRGSLSEWFRRR
jgi:hypothetical protein